MNAYQIAQALKSRNVVVADKGTAFGLMVGAARIWVGAAASTSTDVTKGFVANAMNGYAIQGMVRRGEITMDEINALPAQAE